MHKWILVGRSCLSVRRHILSPKILHLFWRNFVLLTYTQCSRPVFSRLEFNVQLWVSINIAVSIYKGKCYVCRNVGNNYYYTSIIPESRIQGTPTVGTQNKKELSSHIINPEDGNCCVRRNVGKDSKLCATYFWKSNYKLHKKFSWKFRFMITQIVRKTESDIIIQ
jgi:hypothetical protein